MIKPSKSDIYEAGWRMSANIDDTIVSRCADEVLNAYILKRVDSQAVTDAVKTDVIGKAWIALTFLRIAQDNVFATAVGGEVKNFEYGQIASSFYYIKQGCAVLLKNLESVATLSNEFEDVCEVFFGTQMFN